MLAQDSLFLGLRTVPILTRDIDQNARNQLAKHKQFYLFVKFLYMYTSHIKNTADFFKTAETAANM